MQMIEISWWISQFLTVCTGVQAIGRHINLISATLPQAYSLVYKYKHTFVLFSWKWFGQFLTVFKGILLLFFHPKLLWVDTCYCHIGLVAATFPQDTVRRAVGRSENLSGASGNPRLFESEDFSSYSVKIWGRVCPLAPLVPSSLPPNCYWTLMGNPVKEEKIKWVSKDVFSQNNFCSKTRCFLFSSQLLLKHTWANPRLSGGDKFHK